eukprot:gene11147-11300_t
MPAMTLPMSIGGGYDSSLTTPSSRAVLDMPLGPLVAAGAVPPGARFSSTEVPDYAAAAAAAAAYAQGMGGLIMADPGMAGDMGLGAVLKDERGAGGRGQYQSGSVDDGAAGATSSGGRSGSPSGGRAWARAGRGEGGGHHSAGAGSAGRSSHAKGVCQVEGCYADLKGLRDYHLRYKICEYHLKVSSIMRDGKPQRFCQQCGRFHLLTDFDGNKRSCRARLQRHNARRRKRGEEDATGFSPNSNPPPPPQPTSSSKRARGGSSSQLAVEDQDLLGMHNGLGLPHSAAALMSPAWQQQMRGLGPGPAGALGMGAIGDLSSQQAYMTAMANMAGFAGPAAFHGAAFDPAAAAGAYPGMLGFGQFAGQLGPETDAAAAAATMGLETTAMGAAVAAAPGEEAADDEQRGAAGGNSAASGGYGRHPGSSRDRGSWGAGTGGSVGKGAGGGGDGDGGGEGEGEEGQQAEHRGWAAGLEMLADVAQADVHKLVSPELEAPPTGMAVEEAAEAAVGNTAAAKPDADAAAANVDRSVPTAHLTWQQQTAAGNDDLTYAAQQDKAATTTA